ncbi:signal peptidase I [candidate division KSB1 bacterium]
MADKHGSKGPNEHVHKLKRFWKKFWHFFWEEDTLLSWGVNIVVAFILIKWVIYPGLGMILQTSHPVVAVISNSMEHDGSFDNWWAEQEDWYTSNNISQESFLDYRFKNGFNKGDIMLLKGIKPDKITDGDVIVYTSYIRTEPIIHRVVKVKEEGGSYFYTTKGDHNARTYPFEQGIHSSKVIGKSFLRVPYFGWVKISFVCMIDSFTGKQRFINCMRG